MHGSSSHTNKNCAGRGELEYSTGPGTRQFRPRGWRSLVHPFLLSRPTRLAVRHDALASRVRAQPNTQPPLASLIVGGQRLHQRIDGIFEAPPLAASACAAARSLTPMAEATDAAIRWSGEREAATAASLAGSCASAACSRASTSRTAARDSSTARRSAARSSSYGAEAPLSAAHSSVVCGGCCFGEEARTRPATGWLGVCGSSSSSSSSASSSSS